MKVLTLRDAPFPPNSQMERLSLPKTKWSECPDDGDGGEGFIDLGALDGANVPAGALQGLLDRRHCPLTDPLQSAILPVRSGP